MCTKYCKIWHSAAELITFYLKLECFGLFPKPLSTGASVIIGIKFTLKLFYNVKYMYIREF